MALKNASQTHTLRQMLREIRILHRLDHQNVVKIYHALITTTTKNAQTVRNSNYLKMVLIIVNRFLRVLKNLKIQIALMDQLFHHILQGSILEWNLWILIYIT